MHIIDLILHLSSSSSLLLLFFLLQLIILTDGRHDNDIKNLFKFIHHLEVVFVCGFVLEVRYIRDKSL